MHYSVYYSLPNLPLDLALKVRLNLWNIVKCLNNLTTLTQKLNSNGTISHLFEEIFGGYMMNRTYDDHVLWMWKGRDFEYKNILGVLKSIELLSNKSTRAVPKEITELVGLISLNFEETFYLVKSFQILVHSCYSHIDRLNNNLLRKFLISPQLNTFNTLAYKGNPDLCEAPLQKKCSVEGIAQNY